MPAGETEQSPSGLTVDTLNIVLTEKVRALYRVIDDLERRLEQRFESQQQAILKQEIAVQDRFQTVNEFRGQLADQATKFMPRAEADQRIQQNADRITALEKHHANDLSLVNSRLDVMAGATSGVEKFRTLTLGLIVAAVAIVGLVVGLVVK
jgi:hypothetical protein